MAVSAGQQESRSGAAVTREKILRAAAVAFADKGFGEATFREVGEAAGVSFQLIRHHFGTKEQLWDAVVQLLCKEAQEYGLRQETAISSLPPAQQLSEQIRSLVLYLVEHPELNRIILREAMKDSERYRRVYPIAIEGFQRLMADFLRRMQAAGVVRDDVSADDLSFLLHGAITWRLVAPANSELYDGRPVDSPEVIEAHVDAITRLFLLE
jgi:AcrR family transcriptional regulator